MNGTDFFITWIISHFIIGTGLYMVAKYNEHSFPLGAFIPIVNIYTIISLAGYGVGMFMFMFILSFFSFLGVTLIILRIIFALLILRMGERTLGNPFVSVLSMLLPVIGLPVMGFLMRKKYLKEEKKKIASAESIVVVCTGCKKNLRIKSSIKSFICPSCSTPNKI